MKILISDVDGVLNNGQFLYNETGKCFKIFGAHDADGIRLLKDKIKIIFISADKRGFAITKKRIDDMGCDLYYVNEEQRFDFIKSYGFDNVIFVGDGIYDAKIMPHCFYSFTPKSARKEAKLNAKYITESNASEGAFLDVCLKIIEDKLYE